MKTGLLSLAGMTLGAVVVFYLFALLFTTARTGTFPALLLPFGLAATASFLLVWLDPGRWIVLTASVALPSVLMIASIMLGLRMENRDDWSWALVAAAVLGACALPAWFAHTRRR